MVQMCVRVLCLACGIGVVGSSVPVRAVEYPEHQDLSYFLTESGNKRKIESVADWWIRRDHIVLGMERAMGPLPRSRVAVPLDLREISREIVGTVERRKVSYCTDTPEKRVQAWLLLPLEKAEQPRAAMLCLHQTVQVGKDEPAGVGGGTELRYALELAQRGFVTLAPDYPTLGEYHHDFEKDNYASGSMQAIYDNIRALDLLQSLPEVDRERIGCIGHSLGGHNSIFTACFDARVKAVVSCCGFTRFHKYYGGDLTGWSGPRYMPRIATEFGKSPDRMPFDFSELIAALAPRPFLAVAPLRDANFDVEGVRDVMEAARPVYRLFGREDVLQSRHPDCAHAFPLAEREYAYQFLAHHLQAIRPQTP